MFDKTLKETRIERSKSKYKTMTAFWDKFKKKCKRDLKDVLMVRTTNDSYNILIISIK